MKQIDMFEKRAPGKRRVLKNEKLEGRVLELVAEVDHLIERVFALEEIVNEISKKAP